MWIFTGEQSDCKPIISVCHFISFLNWLWLDKAGTILILKSRQEYRDEFSLCFSQAEWNVPKILTMNSSHRFVHTHHGGYSSIEEFSLTSYISGSFPMQKAAQTPHFYSCSQTCLLCSSWNPSLSEILSLTCRRLSPLWLKQNFSFSLSFPLNKHNLILPRPTPCCCSGCLAMSFSHMNLFLLTLVALVLCCVLVVPTTNSPSFHSKPFTACCASVYVSLKQKLFCLSSPQTLKCTSVTSAYLRPFHLTKVLIY